MGEWKGERNEDPIEEEEEEEQEEEEGAERQKGGQSKGRLYIVLHTIKYAFAKWCSILPFERFMHCLGSGAGEEEAGWWRRKCSVMGPNRRTDLCAQSPR